MIKRIIAFMVVAASATAYAAPQVVDIKNEVLGSGTPGAVGFEQALPVLENDIYHAPQYMAAFPTAATIWPRVVDVPCVRTPVGLKCDGYNWTPKMGRGEYLFFRTHIIEPTPVEVRERVIIKEVPAKKIKQ
jgi:hypothetical protein